MPINVLALFVALPVVALTVFAAYFLHAAAVEQRDRSGTEASEMSDSVDLRGGFFTTLTWVLGIFYIVMGLPKLSSISASVHQFQQWGYSEDFMLLIGGIEFLCAIGILLPRVRLIAAGLLSAVMMGAIYTHIAFDPAWYILLPATCLGALTFVAYESARVEWHDADNMREAAAV